MENNSIREAREIILIILDDLDEKVQCVKQLQPENTKYDDRFSNLFIELNNNINQIAKNNPILAEIILTEVNVRIEWTLYSLKEVTPEKAKRIANHILNYCSGPLFNSIHMFNLSVISGETQEYINRNFECKIQTVLKDIFIGQNGLDALINVMDTPKQIVLNGREGKAYEEFVYFNLEISKLKKIILNKISGPLDRLKYLLLTIYRLAIRMEDCFDLCAKLNPNQEVTINHERERIVVLDYNEEQIVSVFYESEQSIGTTMQWLDEVGKPFLKMLKNEADLLGERLGFQTGWKKEDADSFLTRHDKPQFPFLAFFRFIKSLNIKS